MQNKIGPFFWDWHPLLVQNNIPMKQLSLNLQSERIERLIRVLFKPITLSLSSKSYRLIGVLFQEHVLIG